MGCGNSDSNAVAAEPTPERKDGPARTDSKGKKKRRLVRQPSHRGLMSKLALQFGKIRKSFKHVYKSFKEYATNVDSTLSHESITCDCIRPVLEHVTKQQFTDDKIKELFSISDLSKTSKIDFKQFLIMVGIGYYLQLEVNAQDEIQAGFRVVEKAFSDIDKDKGGTIDGKELKEALFMSSDIDSTELLEQRFRELDFNGDGDIEFPEFLYGIIAWVGGVMVEDDDDDDGEAAANAEANASKMANPLDSAAYTDKKDAQKTETGASSSSSSSSSSSASTTTATSHVNGQTTNNDTSSAPSTAP